MDDPKPQFASVDLTQRPPRGFRVRLGNYVILARMLDKGRATLTGKNGEYEYNTSMDQHLIQFLGFDPDALLKELATGKGDWEIIQWLQAHSKTARAPWEIEAWSAFMERRGPDSDPETLEFFSEYVGKLSKIRGDIKTWFEAIELDDYVSFGGSLEHNYYVKLNQNIPQAPHPFRSAYPAKRMGCRQCTPF